MYKVLEKKLSDMFSSVKTILSIETLEDNADDGLFFEEQVKRIGEIVKRLQYSLG